MLLILLSSLLLIEFRAAEECNFVKCVTGVRSYILNINFKKESFNCKKISDIPLCSENCLHKYFPNALSHSNKDQLSFITFCEENISNRLNANWSCITKHTYRLFACLANVNSLTTNKVREDILLTESCRKYWEFQNCPKQILSTDCGQESSEVIKDLILFILDTYQPVSCEGANVKEVLAMPIYYQLGNNFVEAAKSLDDHHVQVYSCITQLIQDEEDLDGYVCGEYDAGISDCVNYALIKKGKTYPDVRRLLVNIIALSGFKCKQSSFEPKTIITSDSSQPEQIKTDNYHSVKEDTTSDLLEISETEEKSEIPVKDSSDMDKNNTIINMSDSVNKNTKRHMNQDVNSVNAGSRINSPIFILIFCFIILLFIFR